MSNQPMDGGGTVRSRSLLVEDIGVTRGLAADGSAIYAVGGATFALAPGETLGIAGESGSGKTTLVHALLGHVRRGMSAASGVVTLRASDRGAEQRMTLTSPLTFAAVRGRVITLMPQSADQILDPIMTVGAQLTEAYRAVFRLATAGEALCGIVERLCELGFPDPATILRRYPHQLSGGQRQRIALSMVLIGKPSIVILDEATTDLDVVTQHNVLAVIKQLQAAYRFSLVMVSHDLRVLSRMCDRLIVMFGGRVVESGPAARVMANPRHPYTFRLLQRFHLGAAESEEPLREVSRAADGAGIGTAGCTYRGQCALARPRCDEDPPWMGVGPAHEVHCWFHDEIGKLHGARARRRSQMRDADTSSSLPLLTMRNVHASYGSGLFSRHRTPALRGIDLDLLEGEVLGVVGESGSGKTTLARIIAGLHQADRGRIEFDGRSLNEAAASRPLALRRELQIIFQNPGNALNPHLYVREILNRRLRLFEHLPKAAMRERVAELLASVGLRADCSGCRPEELSGGE
ncbi:MAG: ABC transporter ATP-binding protein, partial [Acetobacteraceae bacterium]